MAAGRGLRRGIMQTMRQQQRPATLIRLEPLDASVLLRTAMMQSLFSRASGARAACKASGCPAGVVIPHAASFPHRCHHKYSVLHKAHGPVCLVCVFLFFFFFLCRIVVSVDPFSWWIHARCSLVKCWVQPSQSARPMSWCFFFFLFVYFRMDRLPSPYYYYSFTSMIKYCLDYLQAVVKHGNAMVTEKKGLALPIRKLEPSISLPWLPYQRCASLCLATPARSAVSPPLIHSDHVRLRPPSIAVETILFDPGW